MSASITGNDNDHIEIQQNSSISESGTLRDFGVPYYLPFGTTTGSRAHLTIEPGVELVFGNKAELLVGEGGTPSRITGVGTSAEPIVFRHETGATDGWYGVRMGKQVNPASRFEYVEFRDGGYDGGAPLVLDMNDPIPPDNLANCTFASSSTFGLLCATSNANDYSGHGNTFDNIGGMDISCM